MHKFFSKLGGTLYGVIGGLLVFGASGGLLSYFASGSSAPFLLAFNLAMGVVGVLLYRRGVRLYGASPSPSPTSVATTPAETRAPSNVTNFFATTGKVLAGAIGFIIFMVVLVKVGAEIGLGTSSEPKKKTYTSEIAACERYVTQNATHPSTVDFSWINSVVAERGPHNLVVGSTFTAKNGFGLELSYRVRCYFENGRMTSADIYESK